MNISIVEKSKNENNAQKDYRGLLCVPLEKCFTFEKIKENNHNKKQTKNCTKHNDLFLSTVT